MVIDVHVHPLGYSMIDQSPEIRAFRDRVWRRRVEDAQSSPIALTGKPSGGNALGGKTEEVLFKKMAYYGIDKLVLLPLDVTTRYGGCVVSNEEIKAIVDFDPSRFIGFASVDPFRPDALEVLDHAFGELKLSGLKLNPSKQAFYPDDPMMDKIYEKCLEYNKPIMFHSGMSWEPDCLIKYSRPMNFEPVAVKYPELRICLAHLGWPWATETAMLCLKYPNVYTDTSLSFMDAPTEMVVHTMTQVWGPTWFEHNFQNKVMYGSNRGGNLQMERLSELGLRPDTYKRLMGENALQWLGMEVK